MPGADDQMGCARDSGKRPSILIVEDEPLVASTIKDVLEQLGYGVAGIAASAPEALSLASAGWAQLALVDIRLAGPKDGIEVACALRDDFAIPTIFLSAAADPVTKARATRARPLGFLRKPFRPSQVFNAIERALERSSP